MAHSKQVKVRPPAEWLTGGLGQVVPSILRFVDQQATPETAAAIRIGTFQDLGLIALFGRQSSFALAMSHERAKKQFGVWQGTPFEYIAGTPGHPGLWARDLFSPSLLERSGIPTVGLSEEQMIALRGRGRGAWFLLSRIHGRSGFALGIYGDEPGEVDWFTVPARQDGEG